MHMKGPSGEIRCGYQIAARLGTWELAPKIVAGPDVLLFHAAVREADDFWLAQEPLQLALQVGRTLWVWEGVVPVRDGTTIHVDLQGKPQIAPR
jgi:hypothetical protein